MINSKIKATIPHTKKQKLPHSFDVVSSVGGLPINSFWSGFEMTIILQMLDEDGRPVYYSDSSSGVGLLSIPELKRKTVSTIGDDWEYDVLDIKPITILDKECETVYTGCLQAKIIINLKDGEPLTGWDECGEEYEIPTHNVKYTHFEYSDMNLSVSSTPRYFHALEDPFSVKFKNQDETYLKPLEMFDLEDIYGDGKLLSDRAGDISVILKTIFNDKFTSDINEKILNFVENITDLDLCDIESLEDLSLLVGVRRHEFLHNIPKELLDVIKLASIRYEDVFGVDDKSLVYSLDNVGEELHGDTYITANNVIFYQPKYESEIDPKPVIVPMLTNASSIPYVGQDVYQLKDIDETVINLDENFVYGNNKLDEVELHENPDIILKYIPYIPTKEEWHRLIGHRIEYLLTVNTIATLDEN